MKRTVLESKTNQLFRLKAFIINYALYVMILALLTVYAVLSPSFISFSNIKELLIISSPLLVCAVGMTFVLLIAEIDLSVGSIAGAAGAVWIVCCTKLGLPLGLSTIIGITSGLVFGMINAFLIVKLKINSFLVTLGMQVCGRGLIFLIVSGEQILTTEEIKKIAYSNLFGKISVFIIFAISITVIVALCYRYTGLGRRIQAIGCNPGAAAKVGINVPLTKCLVFSIAGLLAGIAGLMQVSNIGILNPTSVGNNMEFLAITAVVIGGTSLFGGRGSIIPGTLVGVLFLVCIENGLGVLGANPYLYPVVRGIVIYLAMFTDSLKRSTGIGMER